VLPPGALPLDPTEAVPTEALPPDPRSHHCTLSDFPLPMVWHSSCWMEQELIRRWDSECELFYDDILHVQASTYTHWTDFL